MSISGNKRVGEDVKLGRDGLPTPGRMAQLPQGASTEGFQLFEVLLDLLDAWATAVAMVSFWYVWIRPPRPDNPHPAPRPSSGQPDIDCFISEARQMASLSRLYQHAWLMTRL